MRILVTGANGQLGREIRFVSDEFGGLDFVFADREKLDICDADGVDAFVCGDEFDAIVNCAAYTAVDKAEDDVAAAFAINETGVANLAKACKKSGVKLIHISTDYVFDGTATTPIAETAVPSPIGVYGRSKLAGEFAVLSQNLSQSCIIRTAWLYSEFGANFVKTIAKLARERDEISVVNDQIGTPTNVRDLAHAVCTILPQLEKLEKTEIFNYANEGVASWHEFAGEIVRAIGAKCVVKPITTQEYLAMNSGKKIAPRPRYSVLDKSKIRTIFGLEIPQWRESFAKFKN